MGHMNRKGHRGHTKIAFERKRQMAQYLTNGSADPSRPRYAEDAVRHPDPWAGDDPAREGLLDTPGASCGL